MLLKVKLANWIYQSSLNLMNKFDILLTKEAEIYLTLLKNDASRVHIYKAVGKALRLMAENLKHPSLSTHEFHSKHGPNGEKIFESYAQNRTPGAHRIFWYYGPGRQVITIVAITPHP